MDPKSLGGKLERFPANPTQAGYFPGRRKTFFCSLDDRRPTSHFPSTFLSFFWPPCSSYKYVSPAAIICRGGGVRARVGWKKGEVSKWRRQTSLHFLYFSFCMSISAFPSFFPRGKYSTIFHFIVSPKMYVKVSVFKRRIYYNQKKFDAWRIPPQIASLFSSPDRSIPFCDGERERGWEGKRGRGRGCTHGRMPTEISPQSFKTFF